MRRSWQWGVVLSLGYLGLVGLLQWFPPDAPAPELDLVSDEWHEPPRWSYAWVPDDAPRPSSENLVRERLAALVREHPRNAAELSGALEEFDVEGLTSTLEAVLGTLRDVAQVSVHVRDLNTQHVLFDYYGDTPLIPASNQKILTTSAALDLLGSDYTFSTRILHASTTLCALGQGDPVLDADSMAVLAHQVVAAVDLATVDQLLVDDSAFSAEVLGPGYSAEGDGVAYEAPSGAFSINFNSVEVFVSPARAGTPPIVRTVPESTMLEVVNTARSRRSGGVRMRSRAEDGRTVLEVSGGVRTSVSDRRRTGDPGLFAGGVLAHLLAEFSASAPLQVQRGSCDPDDGRWAVVAEHESDPLVDILDRGMAYSNNFISEQVLRTAAWRTTGDPGTWEIGQELLAGYWEAMSGRPDEVIVRNGSGLSREGRLTTQGLVDLISTAHRSAGQGLGLLDTLPVAGDPGTLRSRLRRSGRRVRAKTGTLDGVSGLTGVLTRDDGTPQLGFSILTNVLDSGVMYAKQRRNLEDRIVMALLEALDQYEARHGGA